MLKQKLKKFKFIRNIYSVFRLFTHDFHLSHFKNILWFMRDYFVFKQIKNPAFLRFELYPCLHDKAETTPIDPTYFYQDTWAAEKIFQNKPCTHVDVGSKVATVGIISKFVPTTMVDIRPLPVTLENLTFKKGSITDLPFEDNSIESLSSLCVVEHIGLGRYGDEIDPLGSEKAISELKRVVASKGHLLISVPVDDKNKIYFNAQEHLQGVMF